jgi:transcriptional regulator with XRE-family HTH domain
MTKIKDLQRRWSRDDDDKAAYDGLEGEFRLARALIEARTAAGLSQSQLARRMKTSRLAISALEKLNAREALPRLRELLQDNRRPNFGERTTVAEAARHAIAIISESP